MHNLLQLGQSLCEGLTNLALNDVASKKQEKYVEVGRLVIPKLYQAIVGKKSVLLLKNHCSPLNLIGSDLVSQISTEFYLLTYLVITGLCSKVKEHLFYRVSSYKLELLR